MTIRHHPSDETLAAFVGTTLDEGNSLVVATHLTHCPICRSTVRHFQGVAAAIADSADHGGIAVGPEARARVLQAIGASPQVSRTSMKTSAVEPLRPVSLYEQGDWRWIGPGVQWKPVHVNVDTGTRVFMLKAAPGTRLPDHRHVGTEWTCVIEGAFSHQLGRFGPGDFDEADDAVEHSPFVEREGDCICLVSLNGQIQLKSLIGRVIQPFVRF